MSSNNHFDNSHDQGARAALMSWWRATTARISELRLTRNHGMAERHDPSARRAKLAALILTYQDAWRELARTQEHQRRTELDLLLRHLLGLLWDEIELPLRAVAYQWQRSSLIADFLGVSVRDPDYLEQLSIQLFIWVTEGLRYTVLNDTGNLDALVKTIAHRRLIDTYRRLRGQQRLPTQRLARDAAAQSQAPAPATSYETLSLQQWQAQSQQEIASSDAGPDEVIDLLANRQLAAHIKHYCHTHLPLIEQTIIELRCEEPPVPFEAIAARLGEGWNSAAVRTRFARARRKIRTYLDEHNLL